MGEEEQDRHGNVIQRVIDGSGGSSGFLEDSGSRRGGRGGRTQESPFEDFFGGSSGARKTGKRQVKRSQEDDGTGMLPLICGVILILFVVVATILTIVMDKKDADEDVW